jgi:hypothetical protein
VVDYSRLMGKDEEATLGTLKAHREGIDTMIGGRLFGRAGDKRHCRVRQPSRGGALRDRDPVGCRSAKRRLAGAEPNLREMVVDGENLK